MTDEYRDSYQEDDAERAQILADIEALRAQIAEYKRESAAALQLLDNQRFDRTDAARFAKLAAYLTNAKWRDSVLDGLKPDDEKYITPDSLRAAIDKLEDKP